jgi:hypothetical protein
MPQLDWQIGDDGDWEEQQPGEPVPPPRPPLLRRIVRWVPRWTWYALLSAAAVVAVGFGRATSGSCSDGLIPRAFLPLVLRSYPYPATFTIESSAAVVAVGDVITVSGSLTNDGSQILQLPSYRLAISPESALSPAQRIEARQIKIPPGGSDTFEFSPPSIALQPGSVTVTALVSVVVYSYSDPFSREIQITSAPLVISVMP